VASYYARNFVLSLSRTPGALSDAFPLRIGAIMRVEAIRRASCAPRDRCALSRARLNGFKKPGRAPRAQKRGEGGGGRNGTREAPRGDATVPRGTCNWFALKRGIRAARADSRKTERPFPPLPALFPRCLRNTRVTLRITRSSRVARESIAPILRWTAKLRNDSPRRIRARGPNVSDEFGYESLPARASPRTQALSSPLQSGL